MPCDVFKRLEAEYKSASEQYAQFTFKENRGIRGTTKTEAAKIAREATTRRNALLQQITQHQSNCEVYNSLNASVDN